MSRGATPRVPRRRPSTASVVLVTLLLGALLSTSVWWAYTHDLPTEAELSAAARQGTGR